MQQLYKSLFLIIVCSVFAVKSAFGQCTLTGLNSSYCVDDASVALSGGTAYYGPGVSGGVFYPSIAGVSTRPHKVFTTNGVATGYVVSTTGTYYPYTLSSSALSIANSSSTSVSLGFNFVYFGTTFSTVSLYDNGFIKFAGGSTSATAQLIPNTSTPNTEIAFAWNDLDPSTGTIRYQVFGSAPLRVFVAEYANVQFMGGGDYVTVQVHLFETSNHIEIHSTHNGSIGVNKTMGIENSGGTIGVAIPGRNQSVWTADNDFVSFTPSCTVVQEVNVYALPNAALTVSPASTSICPGNTVNVTIGSSELGVNYQLLNNADNSALSGVFAGNGGNLVIASSALASSTVIKVNAVNASTSCDVDLTNVSNVTVNVPPQITVQPAATQTVCVGQSVTFSVNAGVTTSPTYQWKKGGVDIAGATSSSYTIASVVTGDAATYTVSVGGTCTPAILSSNAVLNVNTLPAITTQPAATQTVCEGSAASFTVVASGTGVSYQWKKNGVDIAGATSATYNIATTVTADAGTYTVVVSGTCSPSVTSSAAVLNINEQPEIITQPAATQTVCVGQSVTFSVNAGVTTSPTYQWKKGGVDIAGATSSSYTIASAVTGDAATYTVSVGGTCTPAILSSNAVLNVNVPPTSFASPQTICSGQTTNVAITNPNSVSGTVFNWTIQASSNVTGALPGSATVIAQSLSSTDGVNQGTVTYQIIGSAAGCSGPPFAVTVTVNPIPNVSASNNLICSGSSANIALTNPNGVANTSFSWTVSSSSNVTGAGIGNGALINQILTSTDGVSNGFVIYSVTPSAGGCPGTPITVRVDVKPISVITTPSSSLSPQICSNQALSFIPTSTVPGTTTYTWTSAFSGPINAASITASGSGTISDTPINTGNISGIVTYHITPHLNGCDGVPVDYVVTVKPLPSATASSVILCSDQNAVISILPAPKNVSGTTFAWTATPSANVTGAADGSGSLISQALATTDKFVGNVTYFITPTASGCSIPPVSVTATVNPVATVDAGVDRNVCEPSTIVVSGTIGGSATSGTWSIVSGAGTISSSTTAGTTVTATYTVMPGDIAGSVIFKLTTNDPDGPGVPGPCSAVSDNLQIDVHKKAIVTVLPSNYTVCEPNQISLSGSLSGSATSGSWTLLSGAGTLTVSSVTGTSVTSSYFPDPILDVTNTVTFRLTTNDPDGSGLCVAEFTDLNIKINKAAKVDAGSDFEVCEDKIVQLNGSYSGTTSTVTWTGGSGASQFSDIHNPLATYTLTAADIAAGTVTLTLTTNDPDGGGAAGPCNPVSDQVTFKINKLPQPQIVGLQPIYAENDPTVTLVGFSSNSSGGTGVFTGPGILAGTSQFDPATSGTGVITITFTFTDNKTCVGVTTASTIVNPVTSLDFDVSNAAGTVVFTRDANGYPLVCANQGDVVLVGSPKNNDGKCVGPPVCPTNSFTAVSTLNINYNAATSQYTINTDGLAAGNYSIKYTYTNEFHATNSVIKDIVVLSAPLAVIDVGNNCIDNAVQFTESSYVPNNLSGGTITNWSWLYGEDLNGSNGAIQEPFYSYSNAGTHNVQLKVTTDQGCSNLASKSIVIGVKPKPDFTWSSFCQGDTTKFINKSTSTFGVIDKYGWDFRDGDTLGISTATKAIPLGKHSGRTLGVWSDPEHTFQNFKAYRVKLWVGTNAGCIDTLSKRVVILDFTAPLPTSAYFNNFENGTGTWFSVPNTANDTLVSWTFGTPAGNRINTASSGVNAWWTGKNKKAALDGSSYYENENSYVVGPCLDLTALERPMISLDYWADTQIGFDGAVVQFSLDGGATWETVGDAQGAGINWYNQRDLLSQPGDQDNFAWSDSLSNWINARYNLDKIPQADRDKVVLRVAFASNNDNPNGRVLNGFAFDNIYVGEKKRTVMVEHFVNNADLTDSKKIDQLLIDQTTLVPKKAKSDFFKIEYHLDIPNNEDTVNMVSPYDSRVRALYYGVSKPPYSIMDGITGSYFDANFNGDLTYFTREEFDKRALEDPLFDIQVDATASSIDRLKASIDIKYLDSLKALSNSVVVYTALVEGTIGILSNVVKKLLPTNAGVIFKGPWDISRPKETVSIDYPVNVHITNPDSLYLVVFVQNNSFDTNSGMSRMIHQATKVKLNKMVGPVVTSLPDDPTQVEIHGIKIYPNPAKNTLFFGSDVKLDKSYTWELVDQRGVSVLHGQLAQDLRVSQQVDVSSLANGIYFVKIGTTKGSVIYKKLAIVNGN